MSSPALSDEEMLMRQGDILNLLGILRAAGLKQHETTIEKDGKVWHVGKMTFAQYFALVLKNYMVDPSDPSEFLTRKRLSYEAKEVWNKMQTFKQLMVVLSCTEDEIQVISAKDWFFHGCKDSKGTMP